MWICVGFLLCVYICIVKRSNYQMRSVDILLTGLSLPQICAWTWIANVICRGLSFVLNCLRWEVVVCFLDIGETVDHHCFKCFIDYSITLQWKSLSSLPVRSNLDYKIGIHYSITTYSALKYNSKYCLTSCPNIAPQSSDMSTCCIFPAPFVTRNWRFLSIINVP